MHVIIKIGDSMNYKQEYIDTFGENEILKTMNNYQVLDRVFNSYVNQFDPNKKTTCDDLLMKESIDHFVTKKILEDSTFTQSYVFKNYCKKMNEVCNTFTINNIYVEPLCNNVFKNKMTQSVMRRYINFNYDIVKNRDYCGQYFESVRYKIEKGERVSQKQLDSLCACVVLNNHCDSDRNKQLFRYILRDMKKYPELKIKNEELSLVTSMVPQYYGFGITNELYKETRIKLGDILDSNGNSDVNAFFRGNNKCVYVGKKLAEKCTSLEKGSIYTHRDVRGLSDIYSLIFVICHELSHYRQLNLSQEKKFDSHGYAYSVNKINNNVYNDYKNANHDSDEIEINADELGWRFTGIILSRLTGDKEFSKICDNNELASCIRRTFSRKKNSTQKYQKEMFYGKYDIEATRDAIRQCPDYVYNSHPQLKIVFKKNGEFNFKCLTENRFVDLGRHAQGNSKGHMGNEIGHYIVSEESDKLIKEINNHAFTHNEMEAIVENLNQLLHADAYYIRDLKKLDLNQYKNTKSQYDLENKLDRIGPFFFFRNVKMYYYLRNVFNAVVKNYPGFDPYYVYHDKWNAGYFIEMLDNANLNTKEAIDYMVKCIDIYEKTNDDVLLYLAGVMKKHVNNYYNSNSDITYINDYQEDTSIKIS